MNDLPIRAVQGLIWPLVSRIYNEEDFGVDVSTETLKEVREKLSVFKDKTNDIDVDNPVASVVSIVDEQLKIAIRERDGAEAFQERTELDKICEQVSEWEDQKYVTVSRPSVFFNHVMNSNTHRDAFEYERLDVDFIDNYCIYRLVLDGKPPVYHVFDRDSSPYSFSVSSNICVPLSAYDSDPGADYDTIGYMPDSYVEHCWSIIEDQNESLVIHRLPNDTGVENTMDRISFATMTGGEDTEYRGYLENKIDDFRQRIEAGQSPTVMIWGAPGVGKSLFCKHLSHKLDLHMVDLDTDALVDGRGHAICEIVAQAHIDVVIIDDLDSIWEGKEHKDKGPLATLNALSHMDCTVLFTVNNIDLMPDAIKRPGRVDWIITAVPGDENDRRRARKCIARKVGVDIPDEKVEKIDKFQQHYTGAHLREVFRRAKATGWDNDEIFSFPHQEVEHVR